jgi:hypothetical protein
LVEYDFHDQVKGDNYNKLDALIVSQSETILRLQKYFISQDGEQI